jgi:hypothetical protein
MFPFHFVLSSHSHHELLRGESITKHGRAADGFGLGRLVLRDIPMLLKETVFESAAGLPFPEKRPCAMTESPSATMHWFS